MGSMVPPSVMNISKNLKNSQNIYFFHESIIFRFDCESTSFYFFICYEICFFLFLLLKLGFVIKCNR